jgi:hypothetical protein
VVGDGGDDWDVSGVPPVDLLSGVRIIVQTPGVSGVSESGLIVTSETFCVLAVLFGSFIFSCG